MRIFINVTYPCHLRIFPRIEENRRHVGGGLLKGGPKDDVILEGGALEEYNSLEGDGGNVLSPKNTLIN